jgi:hypothetical protein
MLRKLRLANRSRNWDLEIGISKLEFGIGDWGLGFGIGNYLKIGVVNGGKLSGDGSVA